MPDNGTDPAEQISTADESIKDVIEVVIAKGESFTEGVKANEGRHKKGSHDVAFGKIFECSVKLSECFRL